MSLLLRILLTHVIIPPLMLFWLWADSHRNRIEWLIKLLTCGSYLSYLLFAGQWEWTSYYLRFLFVILFFTVGCSSYIRSKSLPLYVSRTFRNCFPFGFYVLLTSILILRNGVAFLGHGYAEDPVRLPFPLRNGICYVGNGGSTAALNLHVRTPPQKYALDIKKLNIWGRRATGLLPTLLSDYEIYGDTLFSPCEGVVVNVENAREDIAPHHGNRPRTGGRRPPPAGNHIIIRQGDVRIFLSHLLKGSVLPSAGDTLSEGQPIGRVGNSGNTSEPHLHMHAEKVSGEDVSKSGRGVPMLFDGRFLVRNSLVRR